MTDSDGEGAAPRVWIDTDVGDNPDDAIALLVAAAHPGIDLVGVSVVGDGTDQRMALAESLVGEGVPVTDRPDFSSDVEHVVAIGPLTGVATWDVKMTVMGGLITPLVHRGELREVETNFAADPWAAAAVLSEPGRRVVPLDVTHRMTLAPEEVAVLRGAHPALAAGIDRWPHDVCLHDPLALLIAVGAVACQERTERLSVDGAGRVHTGRGAEHHLVVDADVEAAKAAVLDRLG